MSRTARSISYTLIKEVVCISRDARINTQIRVPEIRLIGAEGEQLGLMPPPKALQLARDSQLDLVEIAPTATPPVCRIMDYTKFKYEQTKREKEARKKQHIMRVKEIRINPKIQEHDYQVKLRHLREFVQRGDKVKVSMMFRGREMSHMEFGKRVLNRLVQEIADVTVLESAPKLEGRIMIFLVRPK